MMCYILFVFIVLVVIIGGVFVVLFGGCVVVIVWDDGNIGVVVCGVCYV